MSTHDSADREPREMDARLNAAEPPQDVAHKYEDEDTRGVDAFAKAMKAKLANKRAEGKYGWDDPDVCSVTDLEGMLRDHYEKGDVVDIANFCMMLHQRGKPWIARAAEPPQDVAKHVATLRRAATATASDEVYGALLTKRELYDAAAALAALARERERIIGQMFDEHGKLQKAERERDEARELIADMAPHWNAMTKGRIWTADVAGQMASIKQRLDAALGKGGG